MEYNLLSILGATATGKTALAVALAKILNTEIISADSRQVYQGMDIGTGKDIDEYENVPYHLIDILPAGSRYNLFDFTRDFKRTFADVVLRKKNAIMCGGSGLYLESVLDDYQLVEVPPNEVLRKSLEKKDLEELVSILKGYGDVHNTTDTSTKKRTIRAIEIAMYSQDKERKLDRKSILNPLIVGIEYPVHERRRLITQRLHRRLEEGLVAEVDDLLTRGIPSENLIYYGLEYKYITLYLIGELSYDEMVSRLNTAIHRFAKRQMTWFRRMEKKGARIHWIDGNISLEEKVSKVLLLWKE